MTEENYTSIPHDDLSTDTWRRANSQPDSPCIISLVIPALEEEKILPRLLAVLTRQVCSRFAAELIVSDGGSSDRTVSIAKETVDVIKLHRSSSRQTISEGRNSGAQAASGDVLVFINADTIPAEPEIFLEFIYQWATGKGKYAHCDALACPVEVIPSERKWSDVIFHNIFNSYLKIITLLGIGAGRGECQIVRADLFRTIGGYNQQLAAGEDFDLFMRIARRAKIAIANELLVYESPRRYRKYGYVRILWSWFLNWLGVTLLHKSISKEWEPVR